MFGLYKEIIWVVPEWIVTTIKKLRGESGVVLSFELGYFRRDEVDAYDEAEEVIGFCDCNRDKSGQKQCYRITDEGGAWNESEEDRKSVV